MNARLAWTMVLALVGFATSAYLVLTHYFQEQIPLACATGGVVDCDLVTSSTESMLGPLPVAVLGVAWFAALMVLIVLRQRRKSDGSLLMAQLGWSVLSLAFVFYLVYAELFLIGAICLWCTLIHAVVIALFLLTLYDATAPTSAYSPT